MVINQTIKPSCIYILNYLGLIDKQIANDNKIVIIDINKENDYTLSESFIISLNSMAEYTLIIDDENINIPNDWINKCLISSQKNTGIYGYKGSLITQNNENYNLIPFIENNNENNKVDILHGSYFFNKAFCLDFVKELNDVSINEKELYISYILQKYMNQNLYVMSTNINNNNQNNNNDNNYNDNNNLKSELVEKYIKKGYKSINQI